MSLARLSARRRKKLPKGHRARSGLRTLLSAALAIPGLLATGEECQAQSAPQGTELRFKYYDYRDWQRSGQDRMDIYSPLVWMRSGIAESWEVEGTFLLDSMSGASPLYLSSLSGASGIGVDDDRKAGDLKVRRYFDRFSLALGGSLSDEDDYKSKSPFLEGKWWTVDQNTVMTAAFSPNFDRITSTNNSELLERRRTWNYLLGITQVINRRSLMQTNLTYTNGDGYQSDQYKVLDNRPQSRDAWAWLARYNLYFPSLDAAMHTNYRFFTDSWNLNSHTVEVAWYQPILESWLVRPNVRYYSQGSSEFFSNEFPPVEDNIFYTTDQRMADFGGLSLGIKVEKQLPHGFAIDFRYERFEQKRGWSMRNSEANGIAPFYGQFFGIGVSKRF